MSALPPRDDDIRFDVDHVMDRALAANEADIAKHGRVLPTLANIVEVAYESFGIGLQKMTEQRFTEAIPWLTTAVDNNVEAARPMLGISLEVAEPIPARRTALGDEREDTLARQLADNEAEDADVGETPIFNTVLADQRDGETPADTKPEEAPERADLVLSHPEPDGHDRVHVVHGLIATGFDLTLQCIVLSHPAPSEWCRQSVGRAWRLTPFASTAEYAFIFADRGHDVAIRGTTPGGLFVIQAKRSEARTAQTERLIGAADAPPRIKDYRPLPARRPPAAVLAPLFDEARKGDPDAVHAVLQAIEPMVIRYCRARLGGRETSYLAADDVAQETCLAVLKALPSYHPEQGSFLYLVRALAAKQVDAARPVIDRHRAAPVPELPQLRSSSSRPDAVAQSVVRPLDPGARMQHLVMHLPQLLQEIIVLRIVVGLSTAETAEALGMTEGAVRVAQHRAMTRLRVGVITEELPDMVEGVVNDHSLGLPAAGLPRCLPGARP